MGGLFLGLAFVPIILGGIVACCATDRCYNNFLSKCCILIAIVVFWAMASTYSAIGTALIAPEAAGTDWVVDNCRDAINGNYDDKDAIDPQGQALFESITEIDAKYNEAVNSKMCSEYCVCSGNSNDPHYIEYASVPEITYAKYGRSWLGQGGYNYTLKPIIFSSYDYNQSVNVAYASETMK